MRTYTIANLLRVPNHPSLVEPPSGPMKMREENTRRLLEHRWRCALKWIEVQIRAGDIEIANETARILRLLPEHRPQVEAVLHVTLEEHVAADVPALPPGPPPEPPQPEAPRARRGAWYLRAIGLSSRGRRPPTAGRGQDVTVALIDTGIDGTHSELTGRVARALTVDANGRVTRAESARDPNGHGTYAASLIAGRTMGVAPASRLISLRALDSRGAGTDTAILAALDWLATTSIGGRPAARIAVLCLGAEDSPGGPPVAYQMAMLSLMDRGILPVVAVGNGGPGQTASPGDCYAVLSVGAVTRNLRVASFSGHGRQNFAGVPYTVPSLVAPGEAVPAAMPAPRLRATLSGATPATAMVAGIAALILERQPTLTAWQLRKQILSQCRYLPEDDGVRQGAGLVQAEGGTTR